MADRPQVPGYSTLETNPLVEALLPSRHSIRDRPYGRFEMTEEQHEELLDTINHLRGKVMRSGYPSRLYDTKLAGWHRVEFNVPNHAARDGIKRRMTECLWCNFKTKPQRKEAG